MDSDSWWQLDAWWKSGALVDVALAALFLECVLLLRWWRGRGGLGPLDVAGQLASGGFLLLALRWEATGGAHHVTALLLAASLPAHLFDLARRRRTTRA